MKVLGRLIWAVWLLLVGSTCFAAKEPTDYGECGFQHNGTEILTMGCDFREAHTTKRSLGPCEYDNATRPNALEKSYHPEIPFSFVSSGFLAAESGVWNLRAMSRGIAIENQLAETEYSSWFRAGQLDNGKFPLIDFQKGNNLVSLKTVNTTGSTWLGRMQAHIDDLATRGAMVNGNPGNMILDIRVQPGGAEAAQQLIGYGQNQGVTVIVKELP
jgi:hypothetical protein